MTDRGRVAAELNSLREMSKGMDSESLVYQLNIQPRLAQLEQRLVGFPVEVV